MAKYLHIQVPKPCNEHWDRMDKRDDGKYCGSCQKTVIDFTTMSDEDLIRFFTKHKKQHLCGHFSDSQLDRDMEVPVKKIPWLRYFFQVAIPAFLVSYKVNAQGVIRRELPPAELIENNSKDKKDHLPITVNGFIRNEQGDPIPGATIKIPGSTKATSADSNGNFKIKMATHEKQIEITALGYEKKLVAISAKYVDVQLNILVMENVIISSTYTTRRMGSIQGGVRIISSTTIIQPNTSNFETKKPAEGMKATESFSVFPNPVKRNSVLTIRLEGSSNNEREVILYNAAGVELLRKTMLTKQLSIPLRLYAAGYHALRIIDKKTGNVLSKPVIVE